jgi:hypothetical protein
MAPAAWARSVDTELAIEIMKEHERAGVDHEHGRELAEHVVEVEGRRRPGDGRRR